MVDEEKRKCPTINFGRIKLFVLDFDGVLTDNKVLIDEDGKEYVFCNRSDGLGIEMLKKKNIGILVISKEKSMVVRERCKKLDIECINCVEDKYSLLIKEVEKRGLNLSEVCFIGNDINDFECVKSAGVGVAVNDAWPALKKVADYITKRKGGEGAIREVADLILG